MAHEPKYYTVICCNCLRFTFIGLYLLQRVYYMVHIHITSEFDKQKDNQILWDIKTLTCQYFQNYWATFDEIYRVYWADA